MIKNNESCMTREDIDTWRYDMSIIPIAYQATVNYGKEKGFSLFDYPFDDDSKAKTFPFTYNEVWLDSIKLRKGYF